jgi:hypothetical protein
MKSRGLVGNFIIHEREKRYFAVDLGLINSLRHFVLKTNLECIPSVLFQGMSF